MGEDLDAVYEVRRQARGVTPPSKHSQWKRWVLMVGGGLFIVTALVAAILLWRAVTYVKTIQASVWARVVDVAPDVEGRVQKLHVHEEQHVTAGEVLAELDDSGLQASLAAAQASRAIRQSQYEQAKANVLLTKANVEGAIAAAAAQVDISSARLANAQASLELREAQVTDEVRGAEARVAEARASLDLLKRGARSEDIAAARERLASAKTLRELYALEVEQSRQLRDQGVDSEHALTVTKTQLARQENEVRTAELTLARLLAGPTEEQIEVAKQALAGREADLALARRAHKEIDRLRTAIKIAEAELASAKGALTRAEARRGEIDVARQQVKVAEAELERAIENLQAEQARRCIRSPINGVVLRTFHKVGEVCRKGEPTIKIIDDSEGFYISGFVREKDAWRVKRGQKAKVEIKVGSGEYCRAVVEEVGGTTASVYEGASISGSQYVGDPVWVKLRPTDLEVEARPGYSARATIRVR